LILLPRGLSTLIDGSKRYRWPAALGIFVVGRAVGWIAQAIEQYESRVLIRPRARYTGTRPTTEMPE
jgi:citrate synthase